MTPLLHRGARDGRRPAPGHRRDLRLRSAPQRARVHRHGVPARARISRSRLASRGSFAARWPALRAVGRAARERARGGARRGIVHRDLKPGNIFLVAGRTSVRSRSSRSSTSASPSCSDRDGGQHSQTQTGHILGTPLYMSPEQARGAKTIDHRTDIYALGCVLFEIVTGQPPFVRKGPAQVIVAHLHETAPRASSLEPSVPPALDELVAQMLAKDPDKRPRAMADVLARLAEPAPGHVATQLLPGGNPRAAPVPSSRRARSAPPAPVGARSRRRAPAPVASAPRVVGARRLGRGRAHARGLRGPGRAAPRARAAARRSATRPPRVVAETEVMRAGQTAAVDLDRRGGGRRRRRRRLRPRALRGTRRSAVQRRIAPVATPDPVARRSLRPLPPRRRPSAESRSPRNPPAPRSGSGTRRRRAAARPSQSSSSRARRRAPCSARLDMSRCPSRSTRRTRARARGPRLPPRPQPPPRRPRTGITPRAPAASRRSRTRTRPLLN